MGEYRTYLIVILTLVVANVAQAEIISLDPNGDSYTDGSVAYSTTTSPTLDTAEAINDHDAQWGFSSDSVGNGMAGLGASLTDPLNDQVWVSRVDTGENCEELVTTIGGLDDSLLYNVYVYHATNTASNQDWAIRAGLTRAEENAASGLYTIGEGSIVDANDLVQLERVLIGSSVSPVSSQIAVYIDDAAGYTPPNKFVRSFYKGIGIEVVPEPATLSLLTPLVVMALRRRKR